MLREPGRKEFNPEARGELEDSMNKLLKDLKQHSREERRKRKLLTEETKYLPSGDYCKKAKSAAEGPSVMEVIKKE